MGCGCSAGKLIDVISSTIEGTTTGACVVSAVGAWPLESVSVIESAVRSASLRQADSTSSKTLSAGIGSERLGGPLERRYYVQLGELCGENPGTPWCLQLSNARDLNDWNQVRDWMAEAGVLSTTAWTGMSAERIVERISRLKLAIRELSEATIERRAPDDEAIRSLNWELRECAMRAKLEANEEHKLIWHTRSLRDSPEGAIGLIAMSASILFSGPDTRRLQRCERQGCGRLFLDFSKNQSRRWCSMSGCGNAEKARRHYQRHRLAVVEQAIRVPA